ncbi:MAG: hypothetical protein HYY30_01125 [Chloroflexi bacterium]|nr:hypothetical protein [Chloroflexota bacterium]
MKVTFPISASPEYIIRFLDDATRDRHITEHFRLPCIGGSGCLGPFIVKCPNATYPDERWNRASGFIDYTCSVPHIEGRDPRLEQDCGPAITFKWVLRDPEHITSVTAECCFPPAKGYFIKLLAEISKTWPESKAAIDGYLGADAASTEEGRETAKGPEAASATNTKYGAHGGTLDRVREAQELIDAGEFKTTACKRAGIDIRTFDRYVLDITYPED